MQPQLLPSVGLVISAPCSVPRWPCHRPSTLQPDRSSPGAVGPGSPSGWSPALTLHIPGQGHLASWPSPAPAGGFAGHSGPLRVLPSCCLGLVSTHGPPGWPGGWAGLWTPCSGLNWQVTALTSMREGWGHRPLCPPRFPVCASRRLAPCFARCCLGWTALALLGLVCGRPAALATFGRVFRPRGPSCRLGERL